MPPKNQEKVKIEWSPNFAYAIGLITSDGVLSNDGRHIRLASKDLELINAFKTALSLNNKITTCYDKGHTKKWLTVEFGDKVFYQFLCSIGVTPRKSRIIQQVNVPDAFFADFLRGLYDGDGTFYTYFDIRWPNSFCYKLSFASASKQFVTWLKQRLTGLYGTKGFLHKGAGVTNLEYVKGDTKKLFRAMYYKNDILLLKRKYKKIKKALIKDQKLRPNMPR